MSKDKKTIRRQKKAPTLREHEARPQVKKTASGGEIWYIRVGDQVRSLTTSNSSASVMDDALKVYSPALKRLAKR